ncbi:MAG: substrate-binding domain-containing protein [Alphaproteobacteria bacterium]|nr:substrate-binding domain-containing protein [Alphaproteobacteria bacterium]
MNRRRHLVVALALISLAALPARAQDKFITVASTTSTEQSGLFGHLLPIFQAKTGIAVRVVAVGTGQALKLGEHGDADVLLVHDRQGEDAFIAGGFGVERHDVMYNDFILVGPTADPAHVTATKSAADALTRIADARAPFVSRGDDSGTHRLERRVWGFAGIDPVAGRRGWYKETGSGMGPALNTAAGLDAYTLADRGTWISFKNRQRLRIVLEGDPVLFNPYGVMLVNPAKHPHVKAALGRAFIAWLVSPEGRQAIADYKIDGEQLFFPSGPGAS